MTNTINEFDRYEVRNETLSAILEAGYGYGAFMRFSGKRDKFDFFGEPFWGPYDYDLPERYVYQLNRVYLCNDSTDYRYSGIAFLSAWDEGDPENGLSSTIAIYDARLNKLHFSAELAGEHTDAIKWFALVMNSTNAPTLVME